MKGYCNDAGLELLAERVRSFIPRKIGLWRADYSPDNLWTEADIDPLKGAGATLNTGFWEPMVKFGDGTWYSVTTSGTVTFAGSPFAPGQYYGYYLAETVDPDALLYVERFDNAPIVITASSPLVFRPRFFVSNPFGVEPPEEDVPTGAISMFGGAVAPTGYLLCDGATYNQADYPALFAVIGTAFGVGGAGTFKVPDLRGRAPIGVGTGTGLSPRALAAQIGAETHTLVGMEIPSHAHNSGINGNGFLVSSSPEVFSISGPGAITARLNVETSTFGGSGAHNNMQPSLAVGFIIKT